MKFFFPVQIEGKLPIAAREEDTVKLNVSIHGIKVLDMSGQVKYSE